MDAYHTLKFLLFVTAPASPMPLLARSPMPAPTSSANPDPTSVSQAAPAFGTMPTLPCSLPPPPAAIPVPAPTSCSTPATTVGYMPAITSSFTSATIAGTIPAPTGVFMPFPTAVPTVLSTAGATLILTPSTIPITMVNPMSASTSSFTPTATSGPIPASTSNTMAAPIAVPTLASSPTPVLTPISTPATMADHMPASTSGLTPVTATCPMPASTSGLTPVTATCRMPAPVDDDTDRFMHIACLLVNVGSKVLRRLLLHHTVNPACSLDQYLAYNRTVICNLQKRQILNKSQIDILFPMGGNTNLADYDITLLSTLFINIVPSLSPQEETMIKTLRENRNKIFAHAKSIMVNPNDYQKYWNDIRLTLLALCKQCGDPDFENEISKEIQDIQVSTVQGTHSVDILRTQSSRIETLEKLVQALMSILALEPKKQSDESES